MIYDIQLCIEYGKAFTCANYPCRIERNLTGEKHSVYIHSAKAWSYDTHLLRNGYAHFGEQQYEIKQWGKVFAYHSDLQMPKRKHSGQKPCEYSQGDKDIFLYETHQIYKRTHIGGILYEYNLCGRVFADHNHILERNPMNVISVVRHLFEKVVFKSIKEHILVRSPINVISVVRPLPNIVIFKIIKEHILYYIGFYECNQC
ncbi:hypothetical protein U0070_003276, partial [Myodes glareolus]